MKGKIDMLYNDIPADKFEFTASVSPNDFFKLQDLFEMNIPNGVEIEFKPTENKCNCAKDTIDGLTYACPLLEQTHIEPPTRSKDFFEREIERLLQFCCEPKTEVIFNEPATILYKDGKKYVCKCDKEDKFSEELGLALCLLKSFGVSYSDFEEMLKGAKRQGVKNEKNKN